MANAIRKMMGACSAQAARRRTVVDVGDRWLSVSEIAVYLGIKRDTVYKWIDRKSMPAHKVGRLWKFRTAENWITGSVRARRETTTPRAASVPKAGTYDSRSGQGRACTPPAQTGSYHGSRTDRAEPVDFAD